MGDSEINDFDSASDSPFLPSECQSRFLHIHRLVVVGSVLYIILYSSRGASLCVKQCSRVRLLLG